MRSALMPVMGAAHAGEYSFTCAASSSKPTVCCATNARSWRPSSTITCIIASASAGSAPGWIRNVSSDSAAASVWRISIVTTWAPRLRAAATWRAVFGWLARFAPHRRIKALFALMSSFVLTSSAPVRPRPYAPRPQQIMVPLHH